MGVLSETLNFFLTLKVSMRYVILNGKDPPNADGLILSFFLSIVID